ncbi:hypothetical protein SLE2022_035750 [Rubroshorea leprosula]
MAGLVGSEFLFIVVLLSFSIGCLAATPPVVKAAYYPSWRSFSPSDVDTSLFTHILYAFLIPNNVTYKFEIDNSMTLLLSNFTATLHNKTPSVKALFSIGGGGDSTQALLARMASSQTTRQTFINSAIETARNLGFDGIDIDWEYPQTQEEMQDLESLFQEWRQAIKAEAEATNRAPLLLTAAVNFSVKILWPVPLSYPVQSINQNLDWVNAMCYDYHGNWDTSVTGAPAALYDPNSNVSTSYGLTSWVQAGVDPKKVVMGLPLYGRTWTLRDPNQHNIGSPAVGVGPGVDGVLTLAEVEQFNKEKNATVVYDTATGSTYSFAGTSWIGYDDATSVNTKIRYAKSLGLGGYFLFAISYESGWEISTQASEAWSNP